MNETFNIKSSLMDHMEDINCFPITVLSNKKIAHDYPIILRLLNSAYKMELDAISYAISWQCIQSQKLIADSI